MRSTPAEEWQRLTKLYGEMSDGELEEVASDFANLTEIAQPILRDEMKKRGLDDPSAPAARKTEPRRPPEQTEGTGEDAPVEYSWKVLLCQCDTVDEAHNLLATLQHEGLDAWVEEPQSTTKFGLRYPEVIVAADQLEEARRIAAQPIPQELLDDGNAPPLEDFVAPLCPKCRSENALLTSSEPTNSWHCDDCGYDWTEAAQADESVAKASS